MLDLGRLAVHGKVADDLAAERLRHRLVAEADAERLHAGLREAAHHLDADPGLVGRARARRDDHAVVALVEQLVHGRRVVAHDLQIRPELAQILDEVVGERVVVVDHQHAYGHACLTASSIACTTPRALARDSSYSYSGLASATVPPPAWMCAMPSLTTTVRMQMHVSSSPPYDSQPTAPPYAPRLIGSSSSMIRIARIFGAPESVPAGRTLRSASIAPTSGRSVPATWETMWITCEWASTSIRRSTCPLPCSHTRPRSLRPRSTSITCSERSFSSARSSCAIAASSSPRGRVPAIGRVLT